MGKVSVRSAQTISLGEETYENISPGVNIEVEVRKGESYLQAFQRAEEICNFLFWKLAMAQYEAALSRRQLGFPTFIQEFFKQYSIPPDVVVKPADDLHPMDV